VSIASSQGGAGVAVRVSDGQSGVDDAAVSVSFGDGSGAHGRSRYSHRYSRPGVYRVTVRVRDNLGNAGVISELVSAR
jgi:hypothetical protein